MSTFLQRFLGWKSLKDGEDAACGDVPPKGEACLVEEALPAKPD